MQIKPPCPDACENVSVNKVEVGSRRHTEDDNESHAVRQWQHATEAIEFWLNGRITVHDVGMRWMPLRSLLPKTALAEES